MFPINGEHVHTYVPPDGNAHRGAGRGPPYEPHVAARNPAHIFPHGSTMRPWKGRTRRRSTSARDREPCSPRHSDPPSKHWRRKAQQHELAEPQNILAGVGLTPIVLAVASLATETWAARSKIETQILASKSVVVPCCCACCAETGTAPHESAPEQSSPPLQLTLRGRRRIVQSVMKIIFLRLRIV